jgi:hypothetical protein
MASSTCDASTLGIGGAVIGPCILRHQHDGPVHQDANGTQWTAPNPDDLAAAVARVRALAADMRTWCSPHGIASDYADRIDEAINGTHADAPA